MSVSQFVIIGNWILEGRYRTKWQRFTSNKGIWLFASIFIVHIIWMLLSDFEAGNIAYGLNDLRIKLPLLLLPFFIGTSDPLNPRQLKWILGFFCAAVTVGTIISGVVILIPGAYLDFRAFSLFISHIRFSLMIALSLFFLVYFLYKTNSKHLKTTLWILIAWHLASLIMLRVLTGMTVFYFSALILYIVFGRKLGTRIRILVLASLLILPAASFIYIKSIAGDYFSIKQKDTALLPALTQSGRKYTNDTLHRDYENGYLVWVGICEKELRKEWNKKSRLPYDSLDLKGNGIKYTLIRYMTSKNILKDSAGIALLSAEDIKNIENGVPNILYMKKTGLYKRIYETIWELDHYFRFNYPNGHSVAQRLEYLKASAKIIRRNFWLGVGTGDVQQAFYHTYDEMKTPLELKYRHRAHNQFVTLLITFGIFGFLWILVVLFYLPYKYRVYRNFIFLASFLTGMLSWLSEDTLETQAGLTFFAFFVILILFGTTITRNEKQEA